MKIAQILGSALAFALHAQVTLAQTTGDVDCVLTEWSSWSGCDSSYTEKRTRSIQTPPNGRGKVCDVLEEKRTCDLKSCIVGSWGPYGRCDLLGLKRRTRPILQYPTAPFICPVTSQRVNCAPVNCGVSQWSEWTVCDGTTAFRTQVRSILVFPNDGGVQCPILIQSEPCPVDCQLSEFGPWSECDANGMRVKKRNVRVQPLYGGKQCDVLEVYEKCPAIDCAVSAWSEWSICSATDTVSTRARSILTEPNNGGAKCPAPEELTETRSCPPEDCVASNEWSAWSECDPVTGKRSQTRTILEQETRGGLACENLIRYEQCPPINCVPDTTWQVAACDEATGLIKRTRGVLVPAQYGGTDCSSTDLVQFDTCAPIDCVPEDTWGPFSDCDAYGKKTKKRGIKIAAKFGGAPCNDLEKTETCPPVDCQVSDWTAFSSCEPNIQVQKRTRTILQVSKFGGLECPTNLEEVKNCPFPDPNGRSIPAVAVGDPHFWSLHGAYFDFIRSGYYTLFHSRNVIIQTYMAPCAYNGNWKPTCNVGFAVATDDTIIRLWITNNAVVTEAKGTTSLNGLSLKKVNGRFLYRVFFKADPSSYIDVNMGRWMGSSYLDVVMSLSSNLLADGNGMLGGATTSKSMEAEAARDVDGLQKKWEVKDQSLNLLTCTDCSKLVSYPRDPRPIIQQFHNSYVAVEESTIPLQAYDGIYTGLNVKQVLTAEDESTETTTTKETKTQEKGKMENQIIQVDNIQQSKVNVTRVKELCHQVIESIPLCPDYIDQKRRDFFIEMTCIEDTVLVGDMSIIDHSKLIYLRACRRKIDNVIVQGNPEEVAFAESDEFELGLADPTTCPDSCNKRGDCLPNGCKCKTGYTGVSCEIFI